MSCLRPVIFRTFWINCLQVQEKHSQTAPNRVVLSLTKSHCPYFIVCKDEIGSPGNPDDTGGGIRPDPAGKVDYTYQMGKFEVSEDMITKFNASQSLTITKDTRGTDKPANGAAASIQGGSSLVHRGTARRFRPWVSCSLTPLPDRRPPQPILDAAVMQSASVSSTECSS